LAENTQVLLLNAMQAQLAGLISGGYSPEYAEKYDWSFLCQKGRQGVVCLLGLDINLMHPMKMARFDTNRLNAARRCSARSRVSSVEHQRYVGKGRAACTAVLRAVALRLESKTAITGTEPDQPRQLLCFDGLIIGLACLRRYPDRSRRGSWLP
jgi:hypothetical protein